mmetsp:Transcript_41412/g.107251  ORF Transcript_41412/g.107251 Transcript_41412/m.107251 type:complete len:113 (-) Transcript_41412:19-357(-)
MGSTCRPPRCASSRTSCRWALLVVRVDRGGHSWVAQAERVGRCWHQVASEVRRIRNRHILDFFQAFSTPSGRYLPKYALQYFYPDHYGSNGEEGTVPCNDDANILFFEATDT